MFKEVQQIKIKEFKDLLEKVESAKKDFYLPVYNKKNQLWDLESALRRGEAGFRGKRTFNLFERFITKRADYKKYQAWLKEYEKLREKIQYLQKEIEFAEEQTETELEKSGILKDIEDLTNEIFFVKKATTLGELDLQPTEAIKMLEANGITPVFDEGDREVFGHSISMMNSSTIEKERTAKDNLANEGQKYFINTTKLVDMLKALLQNKTKNECVEYLKQIHIEDELLQGAMDHEIINDPNQIEQFTNSVCKAVGLTPMKSKDFVIDCSCIKTAKDIVKYIMQSAVESVYPTKIVVVDSETGLQRECS